MNTLQRTALMILPLILCFAGTGCGDSPETDEPAQASQPEGTEGTSKEGAMSYGYFYEGDGIAAASSERFLYSDWEPIEFDYICMDPTCSHQSASCSARTVQDTAGALKDFSLLYQDRLIILHTSSRVVGNEPSETVQDTSTMYQTDVYEADADGSNRRKVAGFSGSIDSPVNTHAAVLVDGKLYFGGPTEVRDRFETDIQSGEQTHTTYVSAAFYCLDLKDYTVETFMVMEDKEGTPAYLYQPYEYDGMVYWCMNYPQDDCAVLYRSVPGTGVYGEILRFDSCAVRFWGAIGDTAYYTYGDLGKTLYARDVSAKDVSAGVEEHEVMTVTGEGMAAVPFVLNGQLLIMTDSRMEGEEHMTEYTVTDPDGKVLDMLRYDDYICFLDVVGDKLVYFRLDSEWEIWWADKEDITNLMEKGVWIGPLYGWHLDTIAN